MLWKPMKPPSGVLEDCDLHLVRFPVIGSPKEDGIRSSGQGGKLLSSTLKDIPCKLVRTVFSDPQFNNLDGELTVGSLTDGLCYSRSMTTIMADDPEPATDIWWNIFDRYDPCEDFFTRLCRAEKQVASITIRPIPGIPPEFMPRIRLVPQRIIHNLQEFLCFERECVDLGYEGAMYRNPLSTYKQGRSTLKNQELMRRKPTEDAEAIVVGTKEEMENTNASYTNEMGRTKRSSSKAGKVGKGTLGGYVVRGLTAYEGVEFYIGTFGTEADNQALWPRRDSLLGKILKFKYQKYGSIDKPRQPIALGFRDERDM